MAHRVPPLAAAIVFVAAGLVATVWSTRRAVIHAFEAVRDGQAVAVQQAVRAELVDLDAPPTAEALQAIVHELQPKGLRYLSVSDARGGPIASAGSAVGTSSPGPGGAMRIAHVGDRVRVEMRVALRHAWGRGVWWIATEVAPVEADSLRAAATRTLAIGALAALVLLAIAVWLVRSELQRRARERERERERRLASLGEMSAVLAHEIRNPLASLKGNAQLLAASLPEGDKPRAKAERVVDEAVRLEKLTQDLLAFVRTGELARAAVSPAALVRDAIGPDVELDDAGAPPKWSLDAPRMREVIVNLVDNAKAAGPPVSARVAVAQRRLAIEIRDHGPGVAAEDRERIFEPFFTGKTRGTGLGLAIAKRIVELHRGTITVDVPDGGGARFRIEIPEA